MAEMVCRWHAHTLEAAIPVSAVRREKETASQRQKNNDCTEASPVVWQ